MASTDKMVYPGSCREPGRCILNGYVSKIENGPVEIPGVFGAETRMRNGIYMMGGMHMGR
jgi:hypothetical protein